MIEEFYNSTSGPCVVIGNGPSLNDIPDSFLDRFPTFGCNTFHMRGYKPTYFVVADDWIPGLWQKQHEAFRGIPKFCLDRMPSLQNWDGENIHRWHRKDGAIWVDRDKYGPTYLNNPGIAFVGIVHAVLQIADWMGYNKFYLVGCDNTGDSKHFHEEDLGSEPFRPDLWEMGFAILQTCLVPRAIVNLSTRHRINGLAWADWRLL